MNVMIEGSCIEPGDADAIFGDGKTIEPYSTVAAEHLPELLVKLGIYKTNS